MPVPNCPKCGKPLIHDAWEDMYSCPRHNEGTYFYYPEELGLTTNKDAGIFHIGESNGNAD